MTEEVDPAEIARLLEAEGVPGLFESRPSSTHRVRAHDRVLPPPPLPTDDDQPRLFDIPREPLAPRTIPVRTHVRRNPRPRKKETTMGEALAPSDPVDLARLHDPQTSHDAAESVLASGSISKSQAWVLGTFRFLDFLSDRLVEEAEAKGLFLAKVNGLIDHDLERTAQTMSVRLTPQRIRTARHDLYLAGYLTKTGEKRKTPYGRDAEVYALTEKGRTVEFTPYWDDRTDG